MRSLIPHITLLLAALALSAGVQPGVVTAQSSDPTVGDCVEGEAEAFLDVGNVRAKILNTGQLFWNGGQNVYEVPKGSGNHSVLRRT